MKKNNNDIVKKHAQTIIDVSNLLADDSDYEGTWQPKLQGLLDFVNSTTKIWSRPMNENEMEDWLNFMEGPARSTNLIISNGVFEGASCDKCGVQVSMDEYCGIDNGQFLCGDCYGELDLRFIHMKIPKLSNADDLENLARYMSWLFRSPYSYHLDDGCPALEDFAVAMTMDQWKTLKSNHSILSQLEGYYDTDIWELYTAFSVTELKTVQNDVTQKVYSKWGDDNILLTRDWKEYDFQAKWQEIYDSV